VGGLGWVARLSFLIVGGINIKTEIDPELKQARKITSYTPYLFVCTYSTGKIKWNRLISCESI
jgi:hypothetical protein